MKKSKKIKAGSNNGSSLVSETKGDGSKPSLATNRKKEVKTERLLDFPDIPDFLKRT